MYFSSMKMFKSDFGSYKYPSIKKYHYILYSFKKRKVVAHENTSITIFIETIMDFQIS